MNFPNNSIVESKSISKNGIFQDDLIPNENFLPLFYYGQLSHWVRDIFQDKSANLWFGTNHYGVIRYNGDTLNYFTDEDGFVGSSVNEIVEDREGNIWFGTNGGLIKFDGEILPISL